MSGSIDFSAYLLRSENWLGSSEEAKTGNHEKDGKLSNDEISSFFSGAHLEIGSSSAGDAKISQLEFDTWYSANTEAIQGYYTANNIDMDEVDRKNEMLKAMLEFIDENSSVLAGENGIKLEDLDTSELRINSETNTVISPKRQSAVTNTISYSEADKAATALYNATEGMSYVDKSTVNKYLMNEGYNSADILMIMNAFQDTYGHSLMSALQTDYGGEQKHELSERLYSAVSELSKSKIGWETENDIPDNIRKETEQFNQSFKDGSRYEYMLNFNEYDASTKAQIMIAFEMMYDSNPLSKINKTSWNKRQNEFVDGILESLRQTANE